MPASRRRFIKQAAGGVIGSWIFSTLPALPHTRPPAANNGQIPPEDEQFWKNVREQFPLAHDRVYFNNGTVGPSPQAVLDEVTKSLAEIDRRGEIGNADAARGKVAAFVKADEAEISLTHNTTEGINIAAWGLPLQRGDEVILTTHEHAGNALPWLNRAHVDGIVVRAFSPMATADENLNRINDLITAKTKAIAVPHITCAAGHILPAKEISTLAHDKGLWSFFDGAHGPGMLDLDLHGLGCDLYASCCHKWMCGPKGTGFLYVRKDLLDVLQARFIGAYSDTGWDMTTAPPRFDGYVATAHRYDFGTQNSALQHGLGATVDFLSQIGIENISRRGKALAAHLQEGLLGLGGRIEMATPVEERSRGAMIGFRVKKMTDTKFGELAGAKGFRIRLVPENHLNIIRVSTHLYNTMEEVDRFIAFVGEVS